MAKENAILDKKEQLNEDLTESFDFDELEEKLQSQLEEELADMQFLAEEKEKIGNPDNLGNVIMDVVWEQFINQVAVTAGEDFIKENRGLHLDLRKEAHIQTTENFADGKIATHNTEIDYQQRKYLNDDGVIYTHTIASLKHTNFHFLVADGPTYFDTSNNPSFTFIRDDGLKEGLMPITPRILMAQGKCTEDADKYFITHITDDAVKKYNEIIRANANEFVIHPDMVLVSESK